MTLLDDGRILIVAGDDLGSAEIFDPATDSFALIPASLSQPRAFHSAALMKSGSVLIAGGMAPDGNYIKDGEVFDIETMGFRVTGNVMKGERKRPAIQVLPDGKVQVIGGDDNHSMEMFNPEGEYFTAYARLGSSSDAIMQSLKSRTRNAFIRAGNGQDVQAQSGNTLPFAELLDRDDYSLTEIPQSGGAVVAGGRNSSGSVLKTAVIMTSSSATVTTDKTDYLPGETVIITGTGWLAGETVALLLDRDNDAPDQFLYATVDQNGEFTNRELVIQDSDLYVIFLLTATGQTSGYTAQTTFTDALCSGMTTVSVSNIGGTTTQGATRVPIYTFSISKTGGDVTFDKVKATYTGTNINDITTAYLYTESNGTTGFQSGAGGDTLRSTVTPGSNTNWDFDPTNFTHTSGTTVQFYFVVDVRATATINNVIDFRVASEGDIKYSTCDWPPVSQVNTWNPSGSTQILASCVTPTAFSVTGGGAYCDGGPGVAVGLSGSQTGVNYQLKNGTTNVGSAVAGTGAAISFGNQTTAGTYTVEATNATTTCSRTMTGSAVVTVNPLPTAFNVTGTGSFCEGGTGVAVGLSGSETGVSYQLKRDGGNVGSAVAGTGGAISFGNQIVAGSYTVVAINASTLCMRNMTGGAVLTVLNTPSIGLSSSAQNVQYSDAISPVTITANDADSAGSSLSIMSEWKKDSGSFTSSPALPSGLALALMSTNPNSRIWTLSGNATVAAGVYTIRFMVSDGTCSSIAQVVITVTKEDATIAYTGDIFVLTASPNISTALVQLSALVTQQNDGAPGDITLARVQFELFKAGNYGSTPDQVVANVPVNSAGIAVTSVNLAVDVWTVKVKIEPSNTYFKSNYDSACLTVELGSNERRVTGGGWVYYASNQKGNFGFTVSTAKNGSLRGNSVFVFHGLDGYDYIVKNNSWNGGGLSFSGNPTAFATFSGRCNVQKVDPDTGAIVTSWGNYRFIVNIKDGDLYNPRQHDSYAITILDGSGNIWRQVGSNTSQLQLGGGNVLVKSRYAESREVRKPPL
jgi:hypothetical protein